MRRYLTLPGHPFPPSSWLHSRFLPPSLREWGPLEGDSGSGSDSDSVFSDAAAVVVVVYACFCYVAV